MYPDAEEIACDIVRDFTGATVEAKVPNPRPAEFIVIRRTGGPRLNMVADEPQLTVEGWAGTDVAAHDLAQSARSALHLARGTVVNDIAIYRVQEFSGPSNLPDAASGQSRYTFSMSIGMRGTRDADPASV